MVRWFILLETMCRRSNLGPQDPNDPMTTTHLVCTVHFFLHLSLRRHFAQLYLHDHLPQSQPQSRSEVRRDEVRCLISATHICFSAEKLGAICSGEQLTHNHYQHTVHSPYMRKRTALTNESQVTFAQLSATLTLFLE